jgi:hypothetical protein
MKKFVRIRTKNSTSRPLRRAILTDHWAICRLGSVTETEDTGLGHLNPIEVNTVESIRNSRDKIRMKTCFSKKKVPQAIAWYPCSQIQDSDQYRHCVNLLQDKDRDLAPTSTKDLPYPIVIKRIYGFQGRGMKLVNNPEEFNTWLDRHPDLDGWYFEQYHNYAREYRLHVSSSDGVFLSWRKLRLKTSTERWFFNSQNCEWYGEQHQLFDKPKSWKKMCIAAVKALKSCGLDIGAVDIRVQSNRNDDPKFIVCEINSAPALGEVGVEKYKKVIKNIINLKANERT